MRWSLRVLSLLLAGAAATMAMADDAALTGDAIKARFVGNTLRGTYPGGKAWAEFYDPSGEIRGHDDIDGSYRGHYTLGDSGICFDFDGTDQDFCGQVIDGAEGIRFTRNGKTITDIGHVIVVPGNPDNL